MTNTDDILKNISDFTKESGKIAKELIEKGYDKAKIFAEAAKLNVDLSNKKRLLGKLYTELGKLYYASRNIEESERIKAVCVKIDESKVAIEKVEAALEALRNADKATEAKSEADKAEDNTESESAVEAILCTDCGATNDTTDEFCVSCGRLLIKD
ncbi:MAG: hypothetical protein PHY15_03895 [Eubacteriales bacterium]|nr:hypothetical protein [Eubacteriales bacterium]MDD4475080.1 hypothetical protein [Eubacteriales bacterium]